ncbi:hypothetical protein C2E23DRAFT_734121 [Lenzites betulinus]|nr:hypothetical protein C2E23DRAFT_734121 [Lenzites betulinus]
MSASQRTSQSPGGAAAHGESPKAGAPYKPALANLPTSAGLARSHAPSAAPMIGQIPSLYDPSMAIPPEGLDYQQWVESYSSGQQYGYAPQGGIPGNVSQVPFQPPPPPPPQGQLHHVQAANPAAPTQNRYNFVQEPYATADQGAGYDGQYAQHVPGDRPQRGMPRIARRGGANVGYPVAPNLRIPEQPSRGAYQQPQQSPHPQQQAFAVQGAAQGGGDSYFYSSVNPDVIPGSGDQQHHHSSYNFVQQYQPEPYASTTYTPNSDFTNLPSSVSTPSVGGTDDSQHAFSSTSSLVSQRGPAQQAQATSSRPPPGPSAKGARAGKQAKRPRLEHTPEDSDTQSDDDLPTLSRMNMTMSVPPQQGQNSLPSRL